MKSPYLLEISVETLAAAVAAERGGADRVELCADLSGGGVTPSPGLMRETRKAVRVPIFAMIRPRGGDFVYSAAEFAQMRHDLEVAKACGMDGVVSGILDKDFAIDIARTKELVEAAKPLPVTFHRAFDEAADLRLALENVIATGATRILTSGGKPRAAEGVEILAELVAAAAGRIEIIPGGGVNADNLTEIVQATGAREFHSGLGTSLPYGKSASSDFESAVRKLSQILGGMGLVATTPRT